MRVAFTLDPFSSRGGGSYSFARTLAVFLRSQGVDVRFDLSYPADVVLIFANHASVMGLSWQMILGARVIHRLDERIDPVEDEARSQKHRHIIALNRYADRTIYQSRFVQANVGAHLSSPGVVIHNGVDLRLFRTTGPRLELEGRPSVLHTTWSIGERKRLDRIQELLDLPMPSLVVHLVGRHAEAEGSWKDHPRVRFHGPREPEDVARFMRSADLLFFPSEMDPCPNTVLEAMACGLPIVFHPSGGTPELVGDAGIPIDCLEASVLLAITQRQAYSTRGLARVQRFGIEAVAQHYLDEMVRLL